MQAEPQVPQGETPQSDRFVVPDRPVVLFALAYLFFHMFFLGHFLFLINYAFSLELSLAEINVFYLAIGTVFLLLLMRDYVIESFHRFRAYGRKNVPDFFIGYGIRILFSAPAIMLIHRFLPDFVTTPNTEALHGMAHQNFLFTGVIAIVLAPILEELLFRGALFGPLRKKNRFLAYAVSCLLFMFLHIQNSLFIVPAPTLFLIGLIYIPPGVALAWVYERSGSIWSSISLHALMNLVGMTLISS